MGDIISSKIKDPYGEDGDEFGRTSCSSASRDFFQKKGGGVYRRFYHHMPMKGAGSLSRFRRFVRGCNSTLTETEGRAKRLISKIHRAINNGYENHLMVSERPCYSPSCSCKGTQYLLCNRSAKTAAYPQTQLLWLAPVRCVVCVTFLLLLLCHFFLFVARSASLNY